MKNFASLSRNIVEDFGLNSKHLENWADSLANSLLNDPLLAGLDPSAYFQRGSRVLIGRSSSDVLTGGSKPDLILGFGGNDKLNGGGGDDFLWGGPGNDRLFGGPGNDRLLGDSGNDLLDGGPGINILEGGTGRDNFVFGTDPGFNTILDFESGQDHLVLRDGLTFEQLAITQSGQDTQIRYLGNPQPTVLLKHVQANSLTASDFFTTSVEPKFDNLVVFGDSLSDNGNLSELVKTITGGLADFPPKILGYDDGRFSNGPIWVDTLAQHLGLRKNQVEDFAFAGATTGTDNGLTNFLPITLPTDVKLPGLQDEINTFTSNLGTANADPHNLYVIWAGANDLFNLPADPTQIPAFLANAVNNIATAITTLADKGATNFLVPNLTDVGLLPRSQGNSAAATSLSIAFNGALATTLAGLEQAHPSLDIIPIDIFSLTHELTDSPAFGFTNVTDPLKDQPALQQKAPNSDRFFFWDDTHPTTRVQTLIADTFQTQLFKAGLVRNGDVYDSTDRAIALNDYAPASGGRSSCDWGSAALEALGLGNSHHGQDPFPGSNSLVQNLASFLS